MIHSTHYLQMRITMEKKRMDDESERWMRTRTLYTSEYRVLMDGTE